MYVGLLTSLRSTDNPDNPWNLTPVQRAVLSHRTRVRSTHAKALDELLFVTSKSLDALRSRAQLPSVAIQALNAIRFIGDSLSQSGGAIHEIPDDFHVIVGALDRPSSDWLLEHLQEEGLVHIGNTAISTRQHPSGTGGIMVSSLQNIRLTISGWERFEAAKHGRPAGNYGFMALEFGDPTLDNFVRDIVKPVVREEMGYELVDMRDVARAGIIDNIMRMQIRDAAFVIADLTHGNNGAYWESGFAEGLGKPVVYICEQSVFDAKGTHFDTNHCTTVPWSPRDAKAFADTLIATLRRSLDLGV